jgi:ribosomal protein S12 methylthiotransferase accessory factor YcaO
LKSVTKTWLALADRTEIKIQPNQTKFYDHHVTKQGDQIRFFLVTTQTKLPLLCAVTEWSGILVTKIGFIADLNATNIAVLNVTKICGP